MTNQPDADIHETHSAVVVLFGDRAYKVKKPVELGFLDFRSATSRAEACLRELALNRRMAPDVYLDVARLVGSDDATLEHVLVMKRMPDELRLTSLLRRGVDCTDHIVALARQLASFHATAHRDAAVSAEGTAVGLGRRWRDNLRESVPFRGNLMPALAYDRIEQLATDFVAGREVLLAERAERGFVVDGHGDLTAEDVYCLSDHPRVLDCLDFDERLRWVDVLDDVAFLAMDLERLGHAEQAALLGARYAEYSGTPHVESLWHHYIAYRAFVRAKVQCIRARQQSIDADAEVSQYLRLALSHLQQGEVRLTLVGGAPGSGKSTLGAILADREGAVLLSSDSIRRELGLETSERYQPDAKAAVYREIHDRAATALQRGESVIADATWGRRADRQFAEDIAARTRSKLVTLECRAPLEVTVRRAQERAQRGGSLSDADGDVARALASNRDPWPQATVVDTSGSIDQALDALGLLRVDAAKDSCR